MLTLKATLNHPIPLDGGSIPEDVYDYLTWVVEYFGLGDWSYTVGGGYVTELILKVPEGRQHAAMVEITHICDDCEFLCT